LAYRSTRRGVAAKPTSGAPVRIIGWFGGFIQKIMDKGSK
jgi:hypothetical protein